MGYCDAQVMAAGTVANASVSNTDQHKVTQRSGGSTDQHSQQQQQRQRLPGSSASPGRPTNQPINQLDTLNLHKTNSQTSHSTNQPKLSALTMSSISVQSSVSSSHNLASICKRQLFEAAGNCHTGHNVKTKHNARSVSSTIRFHSIGKNFNKVQNVGETLVWFGLQRNTYV